MSEADGRQLQLLITGSEPLPKETAGRGGRTPHLQPHTAADNFSHSPSLSSIALASTGLPRKPEQLRCRRSLQEEGAHASPHELLPFPFAFPFPWDAFPAPFPTAAPPALQLPRIRCALPGAGQGQPGHGGEAKVPRWRKAHLGWGFFKAGSA